MVGKRFSEMIDLRREVLLQIVFIFVGKKINPKGTTMPWAEAQLFLCLDRKRDPSVGRQ